jgi:hypothetical protein
MISRHLVLRASEGENGCFEILSLGPDFNVINGTYLKQKSPIDMNFPFFGASPIDGRTWKNVNLNRP